jgi:phosphoenolpyruvate-protein phosphotransferase (PTS system enzyme I)
MVRLRGLGASGGVAVGPAFLLATRVSITPARLAGVPTGAEILRLERALTVADAQIARAQAQLREFGAEEAREILEMHRMLLRSAEVTQQLHEMIEQQRLTAETSVQFAFERLAATFDEMVDPYFRERRSDLEAVGDRILRVLLGLPEVRAGEGAPAGAVAVAPDLSPLCPFQLKRAGVRAIVTEGGGRTSHAALVARALGLPYVLGVPGATMQITTGTELLVDGELGEVVVRPDEEALRVYDRRVRQAESRLQRLRELRGLPARTLDGVEIHLAANVESVEDVTPALENGAQSIGLFRTELLYLERDELPSEEEQYEDALTALRALRGKPAVFRTLDVAPDKLPGGVALPPAPNPALGLRSIRFSLRYREIFRVQLRALYRAAAEGPVRIMFPLVCSVSEVREARAVCAEVCAELARQGLPHDPSTPIGVMVETPSAALTADLLARECDFFSLGTNDLVQYAFAADRDNEDVGYLYRPLHPAILRAIRGVVAGASAVGIPVSLCGDMASDPALTWILLGLGLRTLSMDAEQIGAVKAIVRGTTLEEAERLAAQALGLATEAEIEALVLREMRVRFPLELGRRTDSP